MPAIVMRAQRPCSARQGGSESSRPQTRTAGRCRCVRRTRVQPRHGPTSSCPMSPSRLVASATTQGNRRGVRLPCAWGAAGYHHYVWDGWCSPPCFASPSVRPRWHALRARSRSTTEPPGATVYINDVADGAECERDTLHDRCAARAADASSCSSRTYEPIPRCDGRREGSDPAAPALQARLATGTIVVETEGRDGPGRQGGQGQGRVDPVRIDVPAGSRDSRDHAQRQDAVRGRLLRRATDDEVTINAKIRLARERSAGSCEWWWRR